MVDGFGFLLAEGAEGGHLLSCNAVASEGISHHQEVCLDCRSGYSVAVGHVCFPYWMWLGDRATVEVEVFE